MHGAVPALPTWPALVAVFGAPLSRVQRHHRRARQAPPARMQLVWAACWAGRPADAVSVSQRLLTTSCCRARSTGMGRQPAATSTAMWRENCCELAGTSLLCHFWSIFACLPTSIRGTGTRTYHEHGIGQMGVQGLLDHTKSNIGILKLALKICRKFFGLATIIYGARKRL